MGPASIDPGVRIGHVHLKVADIDCALTFHCGVLGFSLRRAWLPIDAAPGAASGLYFRWRLSPSHRTQHLGKPRRQSTASGQHWALSFGRALSDRAALADALRRLMAAKIPLEGASDHGVSEALYLRDPDDNGVELYWDRPREQWPRGADGELAMFTAPLDLITLLKEPELLPQTAVVGR